MPAHIGIVACSAEGAALCYRTICTEGAAVLGPHAHPEVSMHTHSLADYMRCVHRGDWRGVGELMLASANKLAAIGAEFLICPDNTFHQALPYIEARSPLPWLHIADVVVAEAAARGFRRLGLRARAGWWRASVYPDRSKARAWTTCFRMKMSARQSTASSWTNWCAACSPRRRLPTFSASSHAYATPAATPSSRLHRNPADHQRRELAVADT